MQLKKLITFDQTLFKFIAVGILNTIVGYFVFSLLIFIGLHYSIAIFLSICISVLFNFKTFGALVFNQSENKLIGKFILVYALIYFINLSIVKLTLLIHINIYLGEALAMIVCAACSYLLNKNWVFQVAKNEIN